MHLPVVFVLALSSSAPGVAEPPPSPKALTLAQALALARERAPGTVSARLRVEEAQGRLLTASALFPQNPLLGAAVGARQTIDSRDSTDWELELSQSLGLGQRAPRVEAARAGVLRENASADDAARRLLRDVAAAFLRALHGQEQIGLARASAAAGEEILRVAERRHEAGDISVLDVNVARAARARAGAEVRQAEAARDQALAEIAVRLGLAPGEEVHVTGALEALRQLEAGEPAEDRADLRSLAAEVEQAEAEARLARALARPDLGLTVSRRREEGADVLLGGLTVTLPVFNRGKGARAEAGARVERLRRELVAGRNSAAIEVRTALTIYQRRLEAVEELEKSAGPVLADNESLAVRSYDVGQIGLGDLLVIRREVLETRAAVLSLQLEAALARVDLDFVRGALR